MIFTRVHDLFISAYGIYQDVWAPALEAFLNISCSIGFGYYWGINGVIVGISLSVFLVVFCWKPFFLFRVGFKEPIKEYIKKCVKFLILILLATFSSFYVISTFIYAGTDTLIQWGINACLFMSIYIIISTFLFWAFDSGLRHFFYRIISLIKLKQ